MAESFILYISRLKKSCEQTIFQNKKSIWVKTTTIFIILLLSSCSVDKFIPEDNYLLESVKVQTHDKQFDASQFAQYIHQKGNSRWFSLFKIPMGTYLLSGKDSTKWLNRTLRRLGEEPVLYDSLQAAMSCEDLRTAMQNMGYMNAKVDLSTKRHGKRISAIYTLTPGSPYLIHSLSYDIQDSAISEVLEQYRNQAPLHSDSLFTVSSLDNRRKQITQILNDSGFYHFHKDFIYYTADSTKSARQIDLTLHILPYRKNDQSPIQPHMRYKIGKVRFLHQDSMSNPLSSRTLEDNCLMEEGQYYSASRLRNTYNHFARLGAVSYTNIDIKEDTLSPNTLNTDITLSMRKPNSISFQPEGTNTSGDLGAAASLTYQNWNLFHGSELLSIEARAAFEAIKGLEGYERDNYEEYGLEARLSFPRLLAPFLTKKFRRNSIATSELSASWNLQNRPEFHRRVFSVKWEYKWSDAKKHWAYHLDLLDLNYVYMPWISQTFKHDYLDSLSNRNAILKYNYEDLFIMKTGFGAVYNDANQSLRASVESAGNLLNGLSGVMGFKRNEQNQHTLFNIAFAQYVKFDVDFTRLFKFDARNVLALHGRFGIAWPYGNSTILPFEKRYFAGGANSVRGWSVRELGPGRYRGTDGRIDFINQTGDLKLDLNAEYRTHLFWKFDGAVFIDAGNIWTLRNYPEQPGGQFQWNSFIKDLAVAYGLGLRLNFSFFVLRLDGGMKAVNPAFTTTEEHYPLFHPKWGRDFTFHFAVGLPF